MSDRTLELVHASLHGLAARQRAVADNIANIETPGYRAKTVDFEASLRKALNSFGPQQFRVDEGTSSSPTDAKGNNVNLDDETVTMIETNLRYKLAVETVNEKFSLMRASMKGMS